MQRSLIVLTLASLALETSLEAQPGYDDTGANDLGAVRLVSGSSHVVVSAITGFGQGEALGAAIATTGDLNSDGRTEVIVGSPAPGKQTSRILLFVNTTLSSSGNAFSLDSGELSDNNFAELGTSLAAGFDYANGTSKFIVGAPSFDAPGAVNAGKIVVGNPTVRTPPQSSGGATSGSSCTGAYSFDFNEWIVNGWDFSLGAGAEIYAQYWSRDPQSASHTSLSNALRFLVNP